MSMKARISVVIAMAITSSALLMGNESKAAIGETAPTTVNREGVRAESSSFWPVWVLDGKGERSGLFPVQSTLLGNLQANLLRLHPDLKSMSQRGKLPLFRPTMSAIGIWHGFRVYDIIDGVNGLKQIVLQAGSNRYRLLYSLWGGLIRPEPSRIITMDGKSILSSGGKVEGNGGYYVEIQFDYDSRTGTPSAKSETTLR
jgi:hypothetical protein